MIGHLHVDYIKVLEVVYLVHLGDGRVPHLVHLDLLLRLLLHHHRVHLHLHLVTLIHGLLNVLKLALGLLWHEFHPSCLLRRVLVLDTQRHHGWIVEHGLLAIHSVLPVLRAEGGWIEQRWHLIERSHHVHRHHLIAHQRVLLEGLLTRILLIDRLLRCHRRLNRLLGSFQPP